MSFRFFRRVKLAPGLSLNLSKRGGSISVGPPGLKYTIGTHGTRSTVGIPGTGLYYTEHRGYGQPKDQKQSQQTIQTSQDPGKRLDLGFFARLFTASEEQHFVDGMKQALEGQDEPAIETLSLEDAVPDALFIAGMLNLRHEHYQAALHCFDRAEQDKNQLGQHLEKYELSAHVELPITERITAIIEPDSRGIALARVEAEQALDNWQAALKALTTLYDNDPDDAVVILSMAEVLVADKADKAAWQRVVEITEGVGNHSELEAAILYWKGQALHQLGLLTAARDALTTAFRRKKHRQASLLQAIQYERACVYQALGHKRRAREEFGRIYAQNPDYKDVAQRI